MNVVLFKAGTTVRVTNCDFDVSYEDESFVADRSLTEVDGPLGGGDFPRYSFSIDCAEGTPQRDFFVPGLGPEPASIIIVESQFAASDGALSWRRLWEFIGVLSEGSMLENSYSGIIQHPFEYRLHALPRVYWNARYFRAQNVSDKGGEHVATVSRSQLSAWRGINAEPP